MHLTIPIASDRPTVDDPGGIIVVTDDRVEEFDQRGSTNVSKPSCPSMCTLMSSNRALYDFWGGSFDEDVDRMERGLQSSMMEKVHVNEDDEDDEPNGGFNGLHGWLSPFKWDRVCEQVPQNTKNNVGQSRSSRDHDSQHTRSLQQIKHSEVPMTSSDVSLSHKTAHPESESKSKRVAEVFFGSRHGSSGLSRMKHVEVSPGMIEAGFLDGFGAFILDKAIMIRSSLPRYIGLYPHSADPPLSYKEKLPEPPLRHNLTNTPLYYRPERSNIICYPKNYCRYHRHRSLPGVQFVLKLVGGFFKAILRVVEAVTPAFVLSGLARIILLGRIFTQTLLTRFRKSDQFHNHHSITQVATNRHYVQASKMDITWDDALFEPYVNMDMLEPDLTFERETNGPLLVTSSEELDTGSIMPDGSPDFLDFTPPPDLTSFPDAMNMNMDPSSLPSSLPFPFPPAHPVPTLESDWTSYQMPINLTPEEFSRYFGSLNFSPQPTNMEVYSPMDPTDTNPGLSPTSENVSPLTEGLATPTFSPSGSSPVSIASPSSTRKRTCGFSSCGHKQFDRPCDLNKHLKTHDKHLPCEFAKEGCIWVFCTKKDLDRHVDGVHKKKKPFSCHKCKSQGNDKRFTRKDNWRVHLRKVHGEEV